MSSLQAGFLGVNLPIVDLANDLPLHMAEVFQRDGLVGG